MQYFIAKELCRKTPHVVSVSINRLPIISNDKLSRSWIELDHIRLQRLTSSFIDKLYAATGIYLQRKTMQLTVRKHYNNRTF